MSDEIVLALKDETKGSEEEYRMEARNVSTFLAVSVFWRGSYSNVVRLRAMKS
jgi:hypothetical protein